MARIRTVKPQLPQDEKLASVSRESRLTFLYLITQADDAGYFRGASRILLGQLYPHDADVTEAVLVGWLDQLLAKGLLEAFDSDEGIIGLVVNFTRHQKIDHPSASYLAKLSRKPRESFANGVLSLESRVLSPEKTPLAKASDPLGSLSVGAFYGKHLKPVLWPKGAPRKAQERDVSVLKRQLRNRPRQDVLDAVTECRRQAEADTLQGWIMPGQGFGLMALVADANGGINTFERFRHAAVKRRENE